MRTYILLALILHTTTATIDLQALKETAATKIEKLEHNVAAKLQTIQDQASQSIQQFTDSIDLEKLKKLDILNILPKIQHKGKVIHQTIQHKGKVIHETVQNIPQYKQRVKFYLQRIKSLTGQDLVLAFDAGVPWPARRMDNEDYVLEI